MIAPLRAPQRRTSAPSHGLGAARRAVAASLLRAAPRPRSAAPLAPKLLAWLFAAFALAVAASSFVAANWWTVEKY